MIAWDSGSTISRDSQPRAARRPARSVLRRARPALLLVLPIRLEDLPLERVLLEEVRELRPVDPELARRVRDVPARLLEGPLDLVLLEDHLRVPQAYVVREDGSK